MNQNPDGTLSIPALPVMPDRRTSLRRILLGLLSLLILQLAMLNLAFGDDAALGPGDILKISVLGNSDLNLETKIDESGNITFPLIGVVPLGGLSPAEAENKMDDMLTKGGYLRKAEVHISVSLLQSQQVSVLGQVNKPGRYPIDGKHSVTDVLAEAGGVTPEGSDSVTVIRMRNGKSVKEVIDLADMMRSADMKKNYELTGGDVVFVERAPKFYIYGEVQHPGGYRLERNMTVLQALSTGGGLSPRGTERGIRIKRRNAHGDLQIFEAKSDDVLQTDDIVYVKESWF
jgi:polysaccharide export outer membrane protein